MASYDEYIRKLKEARPGADFEYLYSRIQRKTALRPRIRLALAGGVAAILIMVAVYYSWQNFQVGRGEMLISYVLADEQNGSLPIDYVFGDGTYLKWPVSK